MNQPTSGTLWIVSTPIGNLQDISLRALETLRCSDRIYCEDTRMTQKLLGEHNIKKPLHIYNDHATDGIRNKLLAKLKEGQNIALVSDAGTPLISDPGYKLIQVCHQHGIPVQAIPGPTALIQGLVLSGLPTNTFYFGGFLPSSDLDKQKTVRLLSGINSTLIFYETAKRILKTLTILRPLLGNREIAIARELTKSYEEIIRGTVDDLLDNLSKAPPLKGEIVLLISGTVHPQSPQLMAKRETLLKMAHELGAKKAAALGSDLLDCPKRDVYNFMLQKDD